MKHRTNTKFKISNTLIIVEKTNFKKIDIEDTNMEDETSIWTFGEIKIGTKLFSLVQTYYFGDDPQVYLVKGRVNKGVEIQSLDICSEKMYNPEKIVLSNDKIVFTIPVIEGCTLSNYKKVGEKIITLKYIDGKYKKL